DAASQPCCSQMRRSVENMYREKQDAKTLLTNPKASEKPIGNERIGQKASTKCIHREQSGELRHDSLTFGSDPGSDRREPGRVSNFDCWGKKRVQASHSQAQPEIAQEHQTIGTQ